MFKENGRTSIENQFKVVSFYPSFFSSEEAIQIGVPISMDEIKNVLITFSKDKIPGPGGWPVELFSIFFI